VLAPFFAYYLKGQGKLPLGEALTFRTGANEWVQHEAWPPKRNVIERRLYFQANGKLSFDPAPTTAKPAYDSYVSDPASPVPYRPRPIRLGAGWSTWLVEDQRFVHRRPDVLAWVGDPLEDDLIVSGRIAAHLFASTTGTDSDWIVKLIDVYPEEHPDDWNMAGFQLMVSNEVFRGRYRTGFEKSEPVQPNAVLEYTFGLHTQNYTFRKGHRVMVQVQSTWFPIIDRNPQTFVPNIFEAKAEDFRAATHRVHRTSRYPSRVTIPVVTAAR
jgi:putative CocE/NonD family hydrolase